METDWKMKDVKDMKDISKVSCYQDTSKQLKLLCIIM